MMFGKLAARFGLGNNSTYRHADGSIRHVEPKVKGKAARRLEKKLRRVARERRAA